MKRTAFLFLCIITAVLSSCEPTVKERVRKMDSVVSLPIPLDTVHQHSSAQKDSVPVKKPDTTTSPQSQREGYINEGRVYYTLPYCGGARPSEEILAEKNKLRTLTYTTLKLRDKTGDYLVTTDEKGVFHSGIRSGTYDVYLTEKTNKKIYNVSPETCENCLTQKMATITLAHGTIPSIVIDFRCSPGAKWRP